MLLALLLAAQAAPATTCAVPVPLPPSLAAWQGEGRALAPGGMLMPGKAARVMLVNRKQAGFVVAPGKPAPRATNGGVFVFDVKRRGTFRVALSGRAWIDLVTDAEIQTSTGHEHGPACSGIVKIVDFDLAPGRYSLQISGTPASTLKAMVFAKR